ncbi:hypothetical protein HDF24_21450 [Mucilaginibacter sp. X4EP1]|uniref:hypothetical protein n=1 Tax=Mucilaginibacter sp. X4EP1 TaxID=2723092 RepID=UPI00216808EB|nr:hypothetical protein [Mucilaginibacter sp. X4EP1]MCS3812451.1 hypothetical protein [Mucilaginibacter sp. X4EP1]
MKYINKKKSVLEEYKTTLILLSILLAIMSLVVFMPLKHLKNTDDSIVGTYAR